VILVICHFTGMDQDPQDRPDAQRRPINTDQHPDEKTRLTLFKDDILPTTVVQAAKQYEMPLLWELWSHGKQTNIRSTKNKVIKIDRNRMLKRKIRQTKLKSLKLFEINSTYRPACLRCLLMLVTFHCHHPV